MLYLLVFFGLMYWGYLVLFKRKGGQLGRVIFWMFFVYFLLFMTMNLIFEGFVYVPMALALGFVAWYNSNYWFDSRAAGVLIGVGVSIAAMAVGRFGFDPAVFRL